MMKQGELMFAAVLKKKNSARATYSLETDLGCISLALGLLRCGIYFQIEPYHHPHQALPPP